MVRRGFVRRLVLTVLLLAALLVILNETVFRIRSVSVEGNSMFSSGDVAVLAGLDGGVSYFFVDEERIAAGINSNRYLVFRGLEKTFPNRLKIRVSERIPCCAVKGPGGWYLMDQSGMVLEQIGADGPEGWLTITGLTVREIRVGSVVSAANPEQMKACTQVLGEMLVQDAAGLFSDINCADPDKIFLTCAQGYTISLGSAKDMRAKLLTARGVLEYMQIYKMPPGNMDASVPGYITYTPE